MGNSQLLQEWLDQNQWMIYRLLDHGGIFLCVDSLDFDRLSIGLNNEWLWIL
jgi:hypothetical protein